MQLAGERFSAANPTDSIDAPVPPSAPPHDKITTQLSGLLHSLKRLSELQLSIWIKQVKNAVSRMVLFALLSIVALVFVLVGVIFLYAGIYHVLTDILHIPTVWALLIFAGAHIVIAGILGVVAVSFLHRKDKDKRTDKENRSA